jgi:cytochrome c peroxidase
MPRIRLALAVLLAVAPRPALAHNLPIPGPLSEVPIPAVPGLLDGAQPLVVDPQAAVALGKALFWEQNLGSDGMACASCHFHAGADSRTRNALAPGRGGSFEPLVSGAPGGPNHVLRLADLPLLVLQVPGDRTSLPRFVTDDVVSSAGTFGGDFVRALDLHTDLCTGGEDAVFAKDGVRTRRAEPRHSPSVLNSVFYHRQFFDGRASNLFNGRNHLGERDAGATIFVRAGKGSARRVKLRLANSSLASQAMLPPLDDLEMSCRQRTFPDLARKLLPARPLESQEVHAEDGVLGPLRHESGLGLDASYRELVERAFDPRLWSARTGAFGPYDHMEANFSLFFGLAIQLYESTLVSDEAPFDTSRRNAAGFPIDLRPEALRGLVLFMGKAHCIDCHRGAEFTSASISEIDPPSLQAPRSRRKKPDGPAVVDRIALADGDIALVDRGFFNTGVGPWQHDPGVAGEDAAGRPLSFAAQYQAFLAGGKVADESLVGRVSSCGFLFPFTSDFAGAELKKGVVESDCLDPATARVPSRRSARGEGALPEAGRLRLAVEGAFKVPTLRNVELNGPYMHNGGFATLRQVIDFYDRGSNFDEVRNPYLHGLIFQMLLDETEKRDLEAFLLTLTDERVRWERAPFDHPALRIPDGHGEALAGGSPPRASDEFLELPAVGRNGRTPEQGPLLPFEARVAP